MQLHFKYIVETGELPPRVRAHLYEEVNDLLNIIASLVDREEYDDTFLTQPLHRTLSLWITEKSDDGVIVEPEDLASLNMILVEEFKKFLDVLLEKRNWCLYKIDVECLSLLKDRTLVKVNSTNKLPNISEDEADDLTQQAIVYMERIIRLLF